VLGVIATADLMVAQRLTGEWSYFAIYAASTATPILTEAWPSHDAPTTFLGY
jgi:hypothetical protein